MKKTKRIAGARSSRIQKRKLTAAQVDAMYRKFTDSIRRPNVEMKSPEKLKVGDLVSIKIEGLFIPQLDFYKNKLTESKVEPSDTAIFFSFEGTEKPIPIKAEFDKNTGWMCARVPGGANDGWMHIFYPAVEKWGPTALLDKIYSGDAIKKYNIKGRHYNEELLKKCQPGLKPNPDTGRTIYFPYTRVRISLRCMGWYDTCSICRFGAIKFDARNKCYVDKDICRGASYKKGAYAGGHFARLEETQCWNCFTGLEEAGEWHSRNCLQRRLKKVCSVDTAACCSICSLGSMLVDSLDLMDLCPYGAISDSGGGFVVDPAVCVGCMACYNGITCYLNTDDAVSDLTVRMVSYIER